MENTFPESSDHLTDPRRFDRFRNQFNTLAKEFLVHDIIPAEAQFLFLLESPHIQELKFGAPVSGASGASMTRILFGERYEKFPLGILVKRNLDHQLERPSIQMIGLMNVCQIPMQQVAYADTGRDPQYTELFRIFEGLRSANTRSQFADEDWNVVQAIIVGHLRRKLRLLQDRSFVIVPCGRFSQKFFRLAAVSSPQWTILHDIPHPSYNNWSKSSYEVAIHALVEHFHSRLPTSPA